MTLTFELGFWLGWGIGGTIGCTLIYFIFRHIAIKRGLWNLLKDRKQKG